jgi:hypothetical protein
MRATDTDFQTVRRHIREGETRVANQREVVAFLRDRGHPTDLAECLLENLETALDNHWQHLARLKAGHS